MLSTVTPLTPGNPVTRICALGADAISTINSDQCTWVHRRIARELGIVPDARLAGASSASPRLGEPLDQHTAISAACFAVLPQARAVAVAGYWDATLRFFTLEGRPLGIGRGHVATLTCVAGRNGVLVTGSRDATVCVWRCATQGALRPPELPSAVLVGHEAAVTCVAVDPGLDTVASGSVGLCLVHKLSGVLMRVIRHGGSQLHMLAISPYGWLVAALKDKGSAQLECAYQVRSNGALAPLTIQPPQVQTSTAGRSAPWRRTSC